jgi:hypothetical protein
MKLSEDDKIRQDQLKCNGTKLTCGKACGGNYWDEIYSLDLSNLCLADLIWNQNVPMLVVCFELFCYHWENNSSDYSDPYYQGLGYKLQDLYDWYQFRKVNGDWYDIDYMSEDQEQLEELIKERMWFWT